MARKATPPTGKTAKALSHEEATRRNMAIRLDGLTIGGRLGQGRSPGRRRRAHAGPETLTRHTSFVMANVTVVIFPVATVKPAVGQPTVSPVLAWKVAPDTV